jgi:OmpA-OmpF porin, OOP family
MHSVHCPRSRPVPFLPLRLLCCLLPALSAAPAALARPAAADTPVPSADKPVIAAGTVPDEATRAAVLARLRELYGAQRVVDRIEVDAVMAPPNWRDRVVAMLGPDLQQVHGGELAVKGNSVRIAGQVGNEAERQQVASALATAAGPSFLLKNALRGGGNRQQQVLDRALADRIIEFESGSATLTSAGRAILDEMAVAMKQVGDQQVQVIGHTDDVGAREANVALSLQRAIAVKAYLESAGVAADNLGVQSFGPDRPVADNATVEGRARNRRIEFRVL